MKKLFDQAVLFCMRKESLTRKQVIGLLRCPQDGWVPSSFRYALAKAFYKHLSQEWAIKAAYVFGSAVHGTTCPTADIDLILWVNRKTAIFISVLMDANISLTEHYRREVGGPASGIKSLFDLKVVDNEDVEHGRNCACLINSLYNRAIKL